jgi:cytochrome b561
MHQANRIHAPMRSASSIFFISGKDRSMKTLDNSMPHAGLKKHHPLTRLLHWGTVLAIVIAATAILLRTQIGDKAWRMLLLDMHRQLGLFVMLAVAARLWVRQRHAMANHMQGMPWVARAGAAACHWLLYALLVGLPLLGWAATSAHNVNLNLLGLIPLPALAPVDSELADELSDYHTLGAWFLLGTVTLHAGAALFHHFIRRDAVLWAMLPDRPAPAAAPTPVTIAAPTAVGYGSEVTE